MNSEYTGIEVFESDSGRETLSLLSKDRESWISTEEDPIKSAGEKNGRVETRKRV